MAEAPRQNASPQDVHDLVTRLHDEGVINLEASMRGAMDRARTLRLSEDEGWYIIGGSRIVLIVRE